MTKLRNFHLRVGITMLGLFLFSILMIRIFLWPAWALFLPLGVCFILIIAISNRTFAPCLQSIDTIQRELEGIPEFRGNQEEVKVQMLYQKFLEVYNQAERLHNGNFEPDNNFGSEEGQNPIHNLSGKLFRVAHELKEATERVVQKNQFQHLFSSEDRSGAWKEMIDDMNTLIAYFSDPIKELNRVIGAMAEGDLTERFHLDSTGELQLMASRLNTALDNIDGLLHQILSNAEIIDESTDNMTVISDEFRVFTDELTTTIGEMSRGSDTQAKYLQSLFEEIEQIEHLALKVQKGAGDINQAAEMGLEESRQGITAIDIVVACMNEIKQSSSKAEAAMEVLKKRSSEITHILSVINEISVQTNLLSLNAAIEAAQAGERGSGFAVVAQEIRKLAGDSKQATKEIESLIDAVQQDIKRTHSVIEEMSTSVGSGETSSKDCKEALDRIFDASGETLLHAKNILGDAKDQLDGVNTISEKAQGVVVIAEQTASGAIEAAASAEEFATGMSNLNSKIQELSKVADFLRQGTSMVKLSGRSAKNIEIFNMKIAYEKEKYLLSALLDNMPDLIYFKDREGRFTRISKSILEYFGFTNYDDLIGKSDFDFYELQFAQKTADEEESIMNSRTPLLNIVEEGVQKDGTKRYVSTTKLPLINVTGEVVGTFGITRDITDFKLSEIKTHELSSENKKNATELKKYKDEIDILNARITELGG